jgi:catechol 2,3-dioxygenase-like lactoylglutathione lyase family enzyme
MKPAPITRIIRISRNVVELDRSTAFYQDRLGFQATGPAFIMDRTLADELGFGARDINVQRLRLGEEEVELVEAGPNARPYPSPNTSAPRSSGFIVKTAPRRVRRQFHAVRIAVRRRLDCPIAAAASRPSSFATRMATRSNCCSLPAMKTHDQLCAPGSTILPSRYPAPRRASLFMQICWD